MKIQAEETNRKLYAYKTPRRDSMYDGNIAEVLQLYGYHFSRRSLELPYFPPVVWIEPTSACNLKCPMCLTGQGRVSKLSNGIMDMELYMSIISQMKDKPIVRTALFFRGDPLLHPNIVEMVAIASDNNLKPYFHTNAMLLKPELSRELILAGLTYISFSIDDETKEGYEKNRLGGLFEQTIDNVRRFLEIKKNLKNDLPFVVIQKVDIDGRGLTKAYKALFDDLPVDQFKLNPMHNWSGEVLGIEVEGDDNRLYPCPDPWQRLTICWDGTVVGCCNDMLQKYVLGDVRENRMEQIWNGEKMKELRRLMKSGENACIPLCKGCTFLSVDDWTI